MHSHRVCCGRTGRRFSGDVLRILGNEWKLKVMAGPADYRVSSAEEQPIRRRRRG
jgi:hypothetical protein